jgi:hypothetical protein
MACRAISESLSILNTAARSRVAREKRQRAHQLSEKQYLVPAGLARNCRFFLSSVLALNRTQRVIGLVLETLPLPEEIAFQG